MHEVELTHSVLGRVVRLQGVGALERFVAVAQHFRLAEDRASRLRLEVFDVADVLALVEDGQRLEDVLDRLCDSDAVLWLAVGSERRQNAGLVVSRHG